MEIAGDRSAAGGRGIRPHLARWPRSSASISTRPPCAKCRWDLPALHRRPCLSEDGLVLERVPLRALL